MSAATSAPVARKAFSVSRSCSAERADSITRQPSAANALAVANPMPRLEPVTRATLPLSLRSMTPSASVYLDRTQRIGVLTCASQHVICVGAGDHKPRSKPDQFALQHSVVANTADPQHLVMHPAGGGHPFVGGAQPWMVNLSRNAEIGRQVTRADQQNVDPIDCSDRFAILDALRGLEHDDDRRLCIELWVQLS